MRSIKTFAGAAMLAASITSVANGQGLRPFHDSWFWGVRGGVMTYRGADAITPAQPGTSTVAPMIGVDWLITRTMGGLYVSYAQAFVNTNGAILNGPTAADSGYRLVNVRGMRRFDFAAMAFPGSYLRLHPYVGFGFTFKYLGDAQAAGTFPSQKQVDYAASAVNDAKAGLGPLFIGGAQYRVKRVSVFGQLLAASTGRDFLLAYGQTMSVSAEFGVRFNFGSSIDER